MTAGSRPGSVHSERASRAYSASIMCSPPAPAVHLAARRIIAVSTRYARSREEADRPAISDYPPPAQVAGVLYNAIFLDQLDGDAYQLQQINRLIAQLPQDRR